MKKTNINIGERRMKTTKGLSMFIIVLGLMLGINSVSWATGRELTTNPVSRLYVHEISGNIFFAIPGTRGTNASCSNHYAYVRFDHPRKKELLAILMLSKAMQLPLNCVYESADPPMTLTSCPINYCELDGSF